MCIPVVPSDREESTRNTVSLALGCTWTAWTTCTGTLISRPPWACTTGAYDAVAGVSRASTVCLTLPPSIRTEISGSSPAGTFVLTAVTVTRTTLPSRSLYSAESPALRVAAAATVVCAIC